MATTKSIKPLSTVENSAERVVDAVRKLSDAYLDGVETGVSSVSTLVGAHVDFAEELAKTGVTTTRDLVAA